MIRILAIPPWQAKMIADENWGLVEKACSRASNCDPEELVSECAFQRAILWAIAEGSNVEALAFTRVVRTADKRRAIEITAIGGKGAPEWAERFRLRMHEYRKAEYAELLTATGRRGWGRIYHLPPIGLTAEGHYVFEDEG